VQDRGSTPSTPEKSGPRQTVPGENPSRYLRSFTRRGPINIHYTFNYVDFVSPFNPFIYIYVAMNFNYAIFIRRYDATTTLARKKLHFPIPEPKENPSGSSGALTSSKSVVVAFRRRTVHTAICPTVTLHMMDELEDGNLHDYIH
jgi:hypothetical protein